MIKQAIDIGNNFKIHIWDGSPPYIASYDNKAYHFESKEELFLVHRITSEIIKLLPKE